MRKAMFVMFVVATALVVSSACDRRGPTSPSNPDPVPDPSKYELIGTPHNLLKEDGSPTSMWATLTQEPNPPRGWTVPVQPVEVGSVKFCGSYDGPETGCLRLHVKVEFRGEYQYPERSPLEPNGSFTPCRQVIEANGRPVGFQIGFSQDEVNFGGKATQMANPLASFNIKAAIEPERLWSAVASEIRWHYAPKHLLVEGKHPAINDSYPEKCGGERGKTAFLLDWQERPK